MKTKKSTTPDLTNSAQENCRIDASPNRGLIRKRFLLAVLLMGASLILFLWGAGGISYGDSVRSTPPKVTASALFYPTFGTPNSALVTDDDAYVIVSVTGATTPCPTMSPCPATSPCPVGPHPTATSTPTGTPANFTTGIQVFSRADLMMNPCGGQQIINFPSSHRLKPVQHIDSIQFFPGSPQVSVGAAIERQGAEFFRLASLDEPCGVDGVIQVPQYPVINLMDTMHLLPTNMG